MMEQHFLKIGDQTFQYAGEPLVALIFEDGIWAGRSNFLCSGSGEEVEKISLHSLEDCFQYMRAWSAGIRYRYGYVLDYANKTIYYDDQRALQYLLEVYFPVQGPKGYFSIFAQKKFS